jgi:hypothetical protein
MQHSQRFFHILNASWKFYSVQVFSTACDSASITSAVSTWQTLSSVGDTEKWGWVGDYSHVFGQTFPVEKRSMRQCVTLMHQPVLLSPHILVKSLHIFMQSP